MLRRLGNMACVLAGLVLAACGSTSEPATKKSPMDTPESAVSKGMTNIEQGKYFVAEKAFERALELEPEHVPARAGQIELAIETERYEDGWEALEKARETDPTDAQHRRLATLEVRLIHAAQREDWYDSAQDAFERAEGAVPGAKNHPELLHAMARAAMTAYRADQDPQRQTDARRYARRLTKTDSPLSADGQTMLTRFDRIERAQVQASPAVRDIATTQALTRRQLALLLDDVLNLPEYLDGVQFNRAEDGETNAQGQSDYAHLEEAEAIQYASRAPLRGLSIEDGWFRPKKTVTREAFALVLQDLLRVRTGDENLAAKHFGNSSSPFSDVAPSRVSFGAIMTAVSRNLMAARNNGAFAPNDFVSGSVAIEALRQLRRVEPGSA